MKVKPLAYCCGLNLNLISFLTSGGVIEGCKNPNATVQDEAAQTETSVCVCIRAGKSEVAKRCAR